MQIVKRREWAEWKRVQSADAQPRARLPIRSTSESPSRLHDEAWRLCLRNLNWLAAENERPNERPNVRGQDHQRKLDEWVQETEGPEGGRGIMCLSSK